MAKRERHEDEAQDRAQTEQAVTEGTEGRYEPDAGSPAPPASSQVPSDTAPTGRASASATAPTGTPIPAEPAAPGTERDYRITLKDAAGNIQIVTARGPDGGIAAQHAMRLRAGWTADHALTVEAEQPPQPHEIAHAEAEAAKRKEAEAHAAAAQQEQERVQREQERAQREQAQKVK